MVRIIVTFALAVIIATPAHAQSKGLTELPEPVTSFGGAVLNHRLYIYGGHTGKAHEYSVETQSNALRRLDLQNPGQWETVSTGPRLQGLAMIAYNGALYRIGGFSAHNHKGEESDLRSVADFARYDPQKNQWEDLPAMPVPRSSHDAVLIGDQLFVAGGWALGPGDPQWHDSAYVVDLSARKLSWDAIPKPPFKRRALALGQLQGQLYVIGGMQENGKPTTDVDIFNPQSGQWTSGPKIVGDGMEGFGASAWCVGDNLFVSTYSGKLQRLSAGADSWKVVAELKTDRFFHRMLPMDQRRLVLVGGASMTTGKFSELEVVDLEKLLQESSTNDKD
jgi:N-acetylneuraminic acid mutarotase